MGGLRLAFDGFSGSAAELRSLLVQGELRFDDLPLMDLIEQALRQAEGWPLVERARLAPELATLVLLWLGSQEGAADAGEDRAKQTVSALLDLEAAAKVLEERVRARAGVIPLPPAPLPASSGIAATDARRLARLAPPSRPRPVLAAIGGFGLREAWRRIRALLAHTRKLDFDRLAPRQFGPRAVHLAALLEAARRGWVRLWQEEPYGVIRVERLRNGGELEEAV